MFVVRRQAPESETYTVRVPFYQCCVYIYTGSVFMQFEVVMWEISGVDKDIVCKVSIGLSWDRIFLSPS